MSQPAATISQVTETQRRIGTLAICLGTLAVPLDSSVNVAFPDIVNAFRLSIPDIQWIVISYTLTYAALMLACGRAGDIVGYRPIFLTGCGAGVIAFTLCAVAPTYGLLLGARVMQGLAAALTLSCGPALLTALYPEDQRTRVLGLYTLVFGVGGALGPFVGGFLVQQWGWPAVYAFRVPIAALALVAGLVLPASATTRGGRFDLMGAALSVAAIAALLLALNQLQHADSVLLLVTLFALFVALTAAFVMQQRRAAHPVIDLNYFRDADFSLLNIGQTLLNLAAFAIWLLVPFYLARISGLSNQAAGVMLAIAPIGVAIAGPIAGRFAGEANARRVAIVGAAAIALGTFMMGSNAGSLALIALAAVLQGLGLGLYQVAYLDIATATLPIKDRGVAGSLVMMTRTLGIVMGATVLTLAFQRFQTSALASGAEERAAFVTGFAAAFDLAAALSLMVVIAALARGWMRR